VPTSTRRPLGNRFAYAPSVRTRLGVWPNRSRPGRSRGCRRPRAASKRCGAAG
jgi:hypothetical protein